MYEIACDDSGDSPIWIAPWNGQMYYELYHDRNTVCLRKIDSDQPRYDWALGKTLSNIGFLRVENE